MQNNSDGERGRFSNLDVCDPDIATCTGENFGIPNPDQNAQPNFGTPQIAPAITSDASWASEEFPSEAPTQAESSPRIVQFASDALCAESSPQEPANDTIVNNRAPRGAASMAVDPAIVTHAAEPSQPARPRNRTRGGANSKPAVAVAAAAPRPAPARPHPASAWRRDVPLAARLSSKKTDGELALVRIERPDPADRPIRSFAIRQATAGPRTAITIVASRAGFERFITDARSSTDEAAHGPRQALPARPELVFSMPVGATGGLNSYLWIHEGDPAHARALAASFNNATMGDKPFLGLSTIADLSSGSGNDPAMDPKRNMIRVRPLVTKAPGASVTFQRVARWQLACWPAAIVASLPPHLRPQVGAAQLDVDDKGNVSLAIAPAPGRWMATRRWLTDNELVVQGAERPPNGSWVMTISGIQGAGPWAHLALEKARSVISAMPGLAAGHSWAPPTIVGNRLHLELETSSDWHPDPDLTVFEVCGQPGAPAARVELYRAVTRTAPGPTIDDGRAAVVACPQPPASAAAPTVVFAAPAVPAAPPAPPVIVDVAAAAVTASAPTPAACVAAPAAPPPPPEPPRAVTVQPSAAPKPRGKAGPFSLRSASAAASPARRVLAAAVTSARLRAAAEATEAAALARASGQSNAGTVAMTAPAAAAAAAVLPPAASNLPARGRSMWAPHQERPDPRDAPAPGSLFPFYGVAVGSSTGVTDSWPVAWSWTHCWPGNRFKGFLTRGDAEAFVRDPYAARLRSRDATRSRSRRAKPAADAQPCAVPADSGNAADAPRAQEARPPAD